MSAPGHARCIAGRDFIVRYIVRLIVDGLEDNALAKNAVEQVFALLDGLRRQVLLHHVAKRARGKRRTRRRSRAHRLDGGHRNRRLINLRRRSGFGRRRCGYCKRRSCRVGGGLLEGRLLGVGLADHGIVIGNLLTFPRGTLVGIACRNRTGGHGLCSRSNRGRNRLRSRSRRCRDCVSSARSGRLERRS